MRRLVWDKEKKKWVDEKEIAEKQELEKIKEIIKKVLRELDFEVEIDLRSGKVRLKIAE